MTVYWLVSFLKFLGRDNSNQQVAWGIIIGLFLGLVPTATLHYFLILGLLVILRVNILAALTSWIFFSMVSFVFQSAIESFGFWFLTSQKFLVPWFARAYHAPFLPFSNFNHSKVMGGTVLALLICPVLFWLSCFIAKRYRAKLHGFWLSTRIQRAYAHARRFND